MRDPELAVSAGAAIFTFIIIAMLCGTGLYSDHMRYGAFTTAQSTILSCRAEAGVNAADKLCGPVPSMRDFQ